MRDQHERHGRKQHDRREILVRVVGQPLVEAGRRREGRGGADQDRVAVGSARATAVAPSVVPAPPRFSTMNGWPSRCSMPLATKRVSASVPPPAGNGTTIFTGRLG